MSAGGCAGVERFQYAFQDPVDIAAQTAGFHFTKEVFRNPTFDLLSFYSLPQLMAQSTQRSGVKDSKTSRLIVYIEGDGRAWLDRFQISPDPTPRGKPMALSLAAQHAAARRSNSTTAILYLARPCQYIMSPYCHAEHWTNARFSHEVSAALNDAISQFKTEQNLEQVPVTMIGYSGGGALAVLLAAQRADVTQLVTVAAVLDHKKWTSRHNVSPLKGSLNPTDFIQDLVAIDQTHICGEEDSRVPCDQAEHFAARLQKSIDGKTPVNVEVTRVDNADHDCCWEERWPQILRDLNEPQIF